MVLLFQKEMSQHKYFTLDSLNQMNMTEMFEELLIRGESMETLRNIKKIQFLKGSHSATLFLR